MNDIKKESLSIGARQLVDYLDSLDADSQVETRLDIECALQGQDVRNISRDLTRFPREVLMEVRLYLEGTFQNHQREESPDSN